MTNSQSVVDTVTVESFSRSVVNDYSANSEHSCNGRPDWVTILVTMEQPSQEALAGLDRSQRHDLLSDYANQRYHALIDWIDDQDLEREFKRIGSPTLFSTVTMISTPRGAKLIRKAPGVVNVVDGANLVLNGQ